MINIDLINKVYSIPYDYKNAKNELLKVIEAVYSKTKDSHFLRKEYYIDVLKEIAEQADNISFFSSNSDKLLFKQIQKKLTGLIRDIIEENKKIFIVHGRDISMRDKVSSTLGRLKLDYVILEEERNNGQTIIEKFLRSAEDCGYAIILFSAEDIGRLKSEEGGFRSRARQNVVLEMGYFLAKVGRRNIFILHSEGDIEKPSDFDGIVYVPFDANGAWKYKLIKELRASKIYIDHKLADKV